MKIMKNSKNKVLQISDDISFKRSFKRYLKILDFHQLYIELNNIKDIPTILSYKKLPMIRDELINRLEKRIPPCLKNKLNKFR